MMRPRVRSRFLRVDVDTGYPDFFFPFQSVSFVNLAYTVIFFEENYERNLEYPRDDLKRELGLKRKKRSSLLDEKREDTVRYDSETPRLIGSPPVPE